MVWGTFFRDEVPQSARLSAGGGVQTLNGQCPNAFGIFFGGASLIIHNWLHWMSPYHLPFCLTNLTPTMVELMQRNLSSQVYLGRLLEMYLYHFLSITILLALLIQHPLTQHIVSVDIKIQKKTKENRHVRKI